MIGRGTQAAALTATVGHGHLVIGRHMGTEGIVGRSIPMPTAGARPRIPGATHRGFLPAGTVSVIPYREFSLLAGLRRSLTPPAALAVEDSPGTFVGGDEAEAVAGSGAMTVAMEDAIVKITEIDHILGTSEAANENEYTTGSENGIGSATNEIGSIFQGLGGLRRLPCEHGPHSPAEISGM